MFPAHLFSHLIHSPEPCLIYNLLFIHLCSFKCLQTLAIYTKSNLLTDHIGHYINFVYYCYYSAFGITTQYQTFRNEEDTTRHDTAIASPQQVRNEDPEVTECSLIASDTEDLDAIDKQLTELSLEEVNFEQNVLEASLQEVGRILKVLI